MLRCVLGAAAGLALAGCAPAPTECIPGETLVDMGDEIIVMTMDCGNASVRSRPATPEDLARLEAPL